MTLEDVSLADLTIWERQPEALGDDSHVEWLRAEIARRGGPADAAAVREALHRRDEERAASARAHAIRGPHATWSRVAMCGCGDETVQLRHGYTREGLLWKGHVCACDGWQCVQCARLCDRMRDCCR